MTMIARLLCAVLLTTLGCAGVSKAQTEKRPPNLIVILVDDMGYADVGFNGCRDIPTPHIDSIAEQGVRFTSGYVTYAVCGPSRAGLITGRYQDRFGFSRNPTIDPSNPNAGVPLSEKNIAELLKPTGYRSMAVGKWHLGTHPTLRPLVRGFDEFFGFLSGGHDYRPEKLTLEDLSQVKHKWDWYRTKLLHNNERIVIDEYLTDELSNAAVDFIDRQGDKPFFLYLAYNAPHTPLQATPKYLARFDHIADKKRKTYAAMVSAVDDGVGRVLAKLNEKGFDEHTIVFFLSDNGGATNNASRNAPLRGAKGSPFEGGVRVPFAVRWTGTYPAGKTYDHPVSALDIAGTIVAEADAPIAPDKPLDGVNLTPYLTDKKTGPPHERLFWRFYDKNTLFVREGGDKLIHERNDDEAQLYDLARDIGENTNRAAANPDRTAELKRHLAAWAEQLEAPAFPGLGSWKP